MAERSTTTLAKPLRQPIKLARAAVRWLRPDEGNTVVPPSEWFRGLVRFEVDPDWEAHAAQPRHHVTSV